MHLGVFNKSLSIDYDCKIEMMRIIPIFIALIIVLSGFYWNIKAGNKEDLKENKQVLSEESEFDKQVPISPPEVTDKITDTEKVENINIENRIGEVNKVSPTPSPVVNSSAIDAFVYPSSKIIQKGSGDLVLESSDDSDVISNWYKAKITALKMNVKTFVTTKTNDKVLNKLVGADGGREIRVEISKEPNNSTVKITVVISNN